MDFKRISPEYSVCASPTVADIGVAAAAGYKAIICNRPDGESDQTPSAEIAAACEANGITFRYIPVQSGNVREQDVTLQAEAMAELRGPVLAYCRSGTRSATLWARAKAGRLSADAILEATAMAGYDLSGIRPILEDVVSLGASQAAQEFEVVIVGGGAGGISTAASLLKRNPNVKIAIIEPREEHYYQPGWTLVGGGVFKRAQTMKPMADVMPSNVKWLKAAAASFEPENNQVVLEDGEKIGYRILVVSAGLKLDWDKVEGLAQTLGKNGVTSNYMFDMAPYTWELVSSMKGGKAIFTQPPMPIKCAGAPQKAMYLSGDAWFRSGALKDIDIEFCNAGGALFGVADYVPALMEYVKKYDATLSFNENLVAVDGPNKTATFEVTKDGETTRVEKKFDMLHVCPPQTGLDFIKNSPLADAGGWVEVNHETLQHVRYGNIFGLGDGCSTPNAKTAAAVRKQAPTVAENVLSVLAGQPPRAVYDGYGSCPLTVERGKIVLAEFLYGGKVAPTFPSWLVKGDAPTRLAWLLKEKLLPPMYWNGMFKGIEWFAKPEILPMSPTPHIAEDACDFEGKKAS